MRRFPLSPFFNHLYYLKKDLLYKFLSNIPKNAFLLAILQKSPRNLFRQNYRFSKNVPVGTLKMPFDFRKLIISKYLDNLKQFTNIQFILHLFVSFLQ